MTTQIGAGEAARTLGVTKATLYAYVSRGIVGRRTAIDGRTSLYDRDEIEALARRDRRRGPTERPSIDVQIATSIAELDDTTPRYRGRPVLELAHTSSFEAVTELLLTGHLPGEAITWPVDRSALARARRLVAAADTTDPIATLTLAALSLGERTDVADTARTLLAIAPSVLGGPQRGDVATRLTRAWSTRPPDELVAAVGRALVLLADHELATSTLAVRVAASVRTSPARALAAGLDVVAGPLHGAAGRAAADLFDRSLTQGARDAVHAVLAGGHRLPGFGHTVYRSGDPRFAPLLDAVRAIPDPSGRIDVVDAVIEEAGQVVGHLPNVDLALGALVFAGDLPRDAPIFAVARIGGWAAHYAEELDERPVRFRGMAR